MVAKKGFTLIELLIVVTILSVLAGAAVPYVQDYLEDSRIARCKTDLEEIKNALQRYELTRGISYAGGDIASLVGPFLSRSLVDPWGAPYAISTAASTVFSKGPNGTTGGGDDVSEAFRPRFAVSQALWVDVNQDGIVNVGDAINLKCTRPIQTISNIAGTDFDLTGVAIPTTYALNTICQGSRIASYTITAMPTNNGFTPGSDTVLIDVGLKDYNNLSPIGDKLTVVAR